LLGARSWGTDADAARLPLIEDNGVAGAVEVDALLERCCCCCCWSCWASRAFLLFFLKTDAMRRMAVDEEVEEGGRKKKKGRRVGWRESGRVTERVRLMCQITAVIERFRTEGGPGREKEKGRQSKNGTADGKDRSVCVWTEEGGKGKRVIVERKNRERTVTNEGREKKHRVTDSGSARWLGSHVRSRPFAIQPLGRPYQPARTPKSGSSSVSPTFKESFATTQASRAIRPDFQRGVFFFFLSWEWIEGTNMIAMSQFGGK
jgi:hypothetical protein